MKKTLFTLLLMGGIASAGQIDVTGADTVSVPGTDTDWTNPDNADNNRVYVQGSQTSKVKLDVTETVYGQYVNGGNLGSVTNVDVTLEDGVQLNLNWNSSSGAYNPTSNTSAVHHVQLGNGAAIISSNSSNNIQFTGQDVQLSMGENSKVQSANYISFGTSYNTSSTTTFAMQQGSAIQAVNANVWSKNMNVTEGTLQVDGSLNLNNVSSLTLSENATIQATKINIASGASLTIKMAEGSLIKSTLQIDLQSVTTALTFSTESAVSAIEEAVSTEGFYTRVLMKSAEESIWYANADARQDHNTNITLSDASLNASGFQYLGVLYTTDGKHFSDSTGQEVIMSGKQYALVYTDTTYLGGDAPKSLMLVATPEPATATLSLLALTGLCARRRRH